GGSESIAIDVRIITATHKNLEQAIKNQEFREDLYYRLNRLPIFIPSLRERGGDLEELTQYFITKVNQQYGRNVTSLSDKEFSSLRKYNRPGNVRELENVICRSIIFMERTETTIFQDHLPELVNGNHTSEQADIVMEKQSLQT